jgi:phosphatidylglycerophosphate synthase
LAFFFDFLDGKIALAKGMLSERGVLWDLVFDRFNEGLFIFAMISLFPYMVIPLAAVFFFGTLLQGTLVAFVRSAYFFGEVSILPKLGRQVLLLLVGTFAYVNPTYAYLAALTTAVLAFLSFIAYFINLSMFV